MPATNDDINLWFKTLIETIHEVAGEELDLDKRAKVRDLSEAALLIVKSVVTDINNIAFYMGERHQREQSK